MVIGIRITPHARAMSRDYSDWAAGTTGEEWKGLMRRIRWGRCRQSLAKWRELGHSFFRAGTPTGR